MTSHVSPTISRISPNALAISEPTELIPSTHISQAPVSFHTTATMAASAAPTRKAGELIAVHIAIATIFTPIITVLSSVKAAISTLTAATGASTAVLRTVNSVPRVPTANATTLKAMPSATKAAPAAAMPAITFSTMTTIFLCAAIHSASLPSPAVIFFTYGAIASETIRPRAI